MKQDKDLEREANVFALMLLMPQKMIMADIKAGIDLGSDDDFKALAKKYGVSKTALAARIALLKIKP